MMGHALKRDAKIRRSDSLEMIRRGNKFDEVLLRSI